MLGVVNDKPVASGVPPVDAANQLTEVPVVPGTAVNVTLPGPHLLAPAEVGCAGRELTEATTGTRPDEFSHPVVELKVAI